jgi:two-component sensor histidine kinase
MDLQVRVAEVAISPDALVPLGLILNELITNALQHAFPAGEGGRLEVTIGEDEKGWITVQVADTGRGLPEGLDLEQGGLGFQLVKALTDQLGGTLALGQHPGASFFLAFPPGLPPP